ncbi:MAG TPA: hypothetical protein VNW46_13335 [Gemmatimonadaceae bacterium]|nr:hypothetical protein [Gemmatimonadaceae bacterium]
MYPDDRELQELDTILSALDHAPPTADANQLIARSRAGDRRARRHRSWAGVAAGAGTLVVAALAAALPESRLGHAIMRAFHHAPPAATRRQDASGGGIALIPTGTVRIVFRSPQPRGEIRIARTTDAALRVTVRGGGAVAYTVASSAVTIDNAGSTASYDIAIPTAAEHVRVLVDTTTVFTADGASHQVGDYVVRLTRP